MNLPTNKKNKGFTLIEIIVSIGVFTFIMFISIGAIYSIFDANRKSQNTRAIIDNLNYTLESMTRTIRFGHTYHCDISQGANDEARDCASGASSMAVIVPGYIRPFLFRLQGGSIQRSLNVGAFWQSLTGPDVTITNLTFRVFGSPKYSNGDMLQPQVIIVVSGYVGTKATSRTTFTIQTTISQRSVDSQ